MLPSLPPITKLRRRAHAPPHGASSTLRGVLRNAAAANPLVPGTPEFNKELEAQRQDVMDSTAKRAASAGHLIRLYGKLGQEPTEVAFGAANSALRSAIQRQRMNNTLGSDVPLPPYTRPVGPAPYIPPRSHSPSTTRRPTLGPGPSEPPMHPKKLTTPTKNNRSTFSKICNTISCGLFRSRRNRGGGRRTIRKRRQPRLARKV